MFSHIPRFKLLLYCGLLLNKDANVLPTPWSEHQQVAELPATVSQVDGTHTVWSVMVRISKTTN